MERYIQPLIAIFVTSSILIIASNLIILYIILYSRSLRCMPKYIVVVSIAVSDLLMGCFAIPVYLRHLIEQHTMDCTENIALEIISDFGVFFIVGWSLVTFNVVTTKRGNSGFPFEIVERAFSACAKCSKILLLWPWLAATCILVPLVVSSVVSFEHPQTFEVFCISNLSRNALIVMNFFAMHLPYYLNVAFLITTLVCYCHGCSRRRSATLVTYSEMNHVDAVEDADPDPPADNPLLCTTPMLIYCLCFLPFITETWLNFVGISHFISMETIYFCLAVSLSRSFLVPMSWLVYKDVREEAAEKCKLIQKLLYACGRNPPTSTSTSVSFSRLQETQPA
ncbi:unnamed protein product [Lymnaea stagnalis]|uniref:G-protein coupled receptors family 1 profile domain-containing protein n=1 Tax=Lymnaea stagnalis TaxID=6523 RepID=A0AAV2H2X9_LYMST